MSHLNVRVVSLVLCLVVGGSFLAGFLVNHYVVMPWVMDQQPSTIHNYYFDYYNRTVTQLNETYFINASYFLVAEFNLTFVFSFRDNTSNAVVGFYFLTGDNRASLYYAFLRGFSPCWANSTLTLGSYDLRSMNYSETLYDAAAWTYTSFLFQPKLLIFVTWEFWDIVVLPSDYPFSLNVLIEVFP